MFFLFFSSSHAPFHPFNPSSSLSFLPPSLLPLSIPTPLLPCPIIRPIPFSTLSPPVHPGPPAPPPPPPLHPLSPPSHPIHLRLPSPGRRVQVFWALQLVTVLFPGAVFHLYAACKTIDQEEILQRPVYTVFYIISVLLRIILEVIAFWLQSHLFGFQVHPLFMCDAIALERSFNVTKCMVPEHFEKTIFLSAMYTFTVITILLCVAEIFEILCRRLGYLNNK
ncbi:unnamed protein product [Arctogadus glacialis]